MIMTDDLFICILQVVSKLDFLTKVANFTDFLNNFTSFGSEMAEFGKLTGERQLVCKTLFIFCSVHNSSITTQTMGYVSIFVFHAG